MFKVSLFSWKKLILLNSIKYIDSNREDIMLQNSSISNKCCSLQLPIPKKSISFHQKSTSGFIDL